jgi:hypothetical protein
MKVGMLWFDGKDVDDVGPRVQAAASYYRNKYGRAPTVCFLHPSMMGEVRLVQVDGVRLRPSDSILRGHLWLGVEEQGA